MKMAPKNKKPAPSAAAEPAVVRLQAAARGFLARRSVRAVREVEREADEARARIARDVEALCGDDPRPRAAAGEALMRLVLRLDAVHGARDYRRRVIRRVLALQDAVDAFDPARAPVAVAAAVTDAGTDEESAAAAEVSSAAEAESETAADAPTDMEVDEAVPDGEDEAGLATGDASADVDETDASDWESEWEMVAAEEHAAASSHDHDAPHQGPAGKDAAAAATNAGACDSVDTRKAMEMVAALCERNEQQCAVITALAERVDALERAVRLMENAEPHRQRAKKLSKAGKGINSSKFVSD
ncbi:hypothetical protein U9M48_002785 [Paspalum notatum var. saurae]|uniref:BAG domain-containing protein n=1 Tax=Paspalum notatum var. saurae TaxID=547442 RepID=A0AAQ3SK44_PASNO